MKPSPERNAFIAQLREGRGIPPVSIALPMRPPSALYQVFSGPGGILFESARQVNRIGRYSFICFAPCLEYRIKDGSASITGELAGRYGALADNHPLKALRAIVNSYTSAHDPALPPFQGGLAGMFAYDFVHYLERIPRNTTDDLRVPDAHFFLYDRLIAIDHERGTCHAICAPGLRSGASDAGAMYDEAAETLMAMADAAAKASTETPVASDARRGPGAIVTDIPRERYLEMVRRAKEYIAAGDIFQTNLSLRVSAQLNGTRPWELYLRLRAINPSPFASYMDMGDYVIAGSSPERLVRVIDGAVDTRPIAGTRPRGRDAGEDNAMRAELLLNEKERAEHIMLIDLERNDLGRVCDYGTVEVDELMTTEEYSHVIHIVSNVKGQLAEGKDALDLVRAAFPGGTITGVPKVRCMEIIDELESFNRGPYTGSTGYISFGGAMDLNIVIRTFTIKGDRAYVQAGAGIVADSEPEREYRECMKKAEALLRALGKT